MIVRPPDAERHLRVVDRDLDRPLLVGGRRTPGLGQRPLRDDRLGLAVRRRHQLAHRQPVRVGRDEHAALAADLDQDPRQDRPGLVAAGRPAHLRDRLGEGAGLGLDPRAARLLQAREVLGRQQPERALVGRAPDLRLGPVGLEVDRGVGQGFHRVAQQSRRDEGGARLGHLHLDRQTRRHLEVGRREGQLPGVGGVEEHAGQRRDPRPRRHPALHGLQRLGQRIAITSELHFGHPLRLLLFLFS